MDIIWDVESGLVSESFPDNKVNKMSIETSPTNNNLFFIEIIDFNARIFYFCSGKLVHNHVGHESDINSVFFLPMVIPLAPDQMNPNLCFLIKYSMKR